MVQATNKERHEVAQRLRERAGKRIINLGELLWCTGCYDGDDAGSWNRLADLIEPSTPEIDYYALVHLADDLSEWSAGDCEICPESPACPHEVNCTDIVVSATARRIREALGAEQ